MPRVHGMRYYAPKGVRKASPRDLEIVADVQRGELTYAEIARKHGLSRADSIYNILERVRDARRDEQLLARLR